MDKDIKRSLDSIEVPMGKLDAAIESGIKEGKLFRESKKRVWPVILSCVAMIVLIIGSGFISPTMANVLAKVPLLDSIFNSSGEPGLRVALEDDNRVNLNKTITSNGVSITIKDIIYDGSRIAFSFTQDQESEIAPLQIEIDNKVINFSESYKGKAIDNGEFEGLIQAFPEEKLPNKFHMVVKIHQIGKTKGDWQFETDMKKSNNHNMELANGQKATIDGIKYKVKKFEVADTGVHLQLEFDAEMEELLNEKRSLMLHVLDQNGQPLSINHMSGTGTESGTMMEYYLDPLGDNIKNVTISPYSIPTTIQIKGVKATLHKEHLPLVLSQGEMGEIVVTKLEKKKEKNVLYFHSTSSFPFSNDFTPNRLAIEDESGNNLITEQPNALSKNHYKLSYIPPRKGKVIIKSGKLPKLQLKQNAQVKINVR
ncbi:DUF4179 domain-containing protein [Rummeliibacillus pycnus]|uniref:DUF4179 domain-containing protein n=1 Tax=Rummeliibacillus pycnus TaxID=101070 RepID=UPI0037C6B228